MTRKEFQSVIVFTFAMLLILVAACSLAKARCSLAQLNWKRQQVGLQPFVYDARLQAAAERSASNQARSNRYYHNSHIGSKSGVGMRSGHDPEGRRFYTCYHTARLGPGWRAGAATVSNGRNTFYALDLLPPSRGAIPQATNNNTGYYCHKCQKWHMR